jgi:hypothetical protein
MKIIILVLSFIIVSLLFVYLGIPKFLFNNSNLISKFYYKNTFISLALDFLFIFIYFIIAFNLSNNFHIIKNPLLNRILFISIVVIVLDLLFASLVKNNFFPQSDLIKFFKDWIKEAGFMGIIWDLIYLNAIVIVDYYLYNNFYKNRIEKVEDYIWLVLTGIILYHYLKNIKLN